MSDLNKHNVITYLEACGKHQEFKNTGKLDAIKQLMEGYAQLYYNNQKRKRINSKIEIA